MGSKSDWPTMKWCADTLKKLQVKFDAKIISAHRTPDRMFKFAKTAEKENYSVIIAGAGGSAHLPGMIASMSTLPVIGVPIESKKLKGLDGDMQHMSSRWHAGRIGVARGSVGRRGR